MARCLPDKETRHAADRTQGPCRLRQRFLRLTLLQGFQSLTKRDLELLIFVLLERDGAVGREESSFTVAGKLRVTPAKVKALRRDGYARWRATGAGRTRRRLQRIVATVLTEANLRAGAKHVSERSRKDGFLAVRIEHPDDHQQFEQAILDVGALPVYERNREVVAVPFPTLLSIAERWGLPATRSAAVTAELKKLTPTAEEWRPAEEGCQQAALAGCTQRAQQPGRQGHRQHGRGWPGRGC